MRRISVSVLSAVLAVIAATAVAVTAAPVASSPSLQTLHGFDTELSLRYEEGFGAGDIYSYNFTHHSPVAVSVSIGKDGAGFKTFRYAPDRKLLASNPMQAYFATGYAQGYAEAQQIWNQWAAGSKAYYHQVTMGAENRVDEWIGTAFINLFHSLQSAMFVDSNDVGSVESGMAKQHAMLMGKALGYSHALEESDSTDAPWIVGTSDSSPPFALGIEELFFMTMEEELRSAVPLAEISTALENKYDQYRPSSSRAIASGASCVVKRAEGNLIVAHIAEGNFASDTQRVVRVYELEQTVVMTGLPGALGSDDFAVMGNGLTVCGAPMRTMNPQFYAQASVTGRRVPHSLARFHAAVESRNASDFFRLVGSNTTGLHPTSWLAVETMHPHKTEGAILAADVVPGFVFVQDVTNMTMSAGSGAVNGTGAVNVSTHVIAVHGIPITSAAKNHFTGAQACSWCAAEGNKAYGFWLRNAATITSNVRTAEEMLTAVRRNSFRTSAMSAPPVFIPHMTVAGCAGLAASPRFDLNPVGLHNLTYADRGCVRKAYGAVDAKIVSSALLAPSTSSHLAFNMVAEMGPTYESVDTPPFNAKTFFCNGTSCDTDLPLSTGPLMKWAPAKFELTVAANERPSSPSNGPVIHAETKQHKVTSSDIAIAVLAPLFLFAVLGAFMYVTRPGGLPASAKVAEEV